MKIIQRIVGIIVVLSVCAAIGYWGFQSDEISFILFAAFILSNRVLPSESDPKFPFMFRIEPRKYITKSSDGAVSGLRKFGRGIRKLGQKLRRKKG